MKKKFSSSWKSSKKQNKQRKYRENAPLHIKQKLAHSAISKELREKYKTRSIGVKRGDKVKVMNGKFKNHEGKIEHINLGKSLVFISGVEITKKDGTKRAIGIDSSNLIITEMNLDDKLRQKLLDR